MTGLFFIVQIWLEEQSSQQNLLKGTSNTGRPMVMCKGASCLAKTSKRSRADLGEGLEALAPS